MSSQRPAAGDVEIGLGERFGAGEDIERRLAAILSADVVGYDRELEDIFAVQDEVTRKIVSTLAGHLEEFGRQRVMEKRTEDLAAYDYLLLGDHCLNQHSLDGILRARQMFQRANDLEPGNARAHTVRAFPPQSPAGTAPRPP